MSEIPNDLKCMTFSKNDISRIENEAYEKGRADKDKELSELPNQYSEKLWKNAYEKGKADMLDKLKEYAESRLDVHFALDILCKQVIEEFIAEQLKEQKND